MPGGPDPEKGHVVCQRCDPAAMALANSAAAAAVAFWTNSLIDYGDTTCDAQDIIVDGCVLTVSSAHGSGNLVVGNGAVVTDSADIAESDPTIVVDLTPRE